MERARPAEAVVSHFSSPAPAPRSQRGPAGAQICLPHNFHSNAGAKAPGGGSQRGGHFAEALTGRLFGLSNRAHLEKGKPGAPREPRERAERSCAGAGGQGTGGQGAPAPGTLQAKLVSVAGGHSRGTDRKRARGDARTRDHGTETARGWATVRSGDGGSRRRGVKRPGRQALLTSWRPAACWQWRTRPLRKGRGQEVGLSVGKLGLPSRELQALCSSGLGPASGCPHRNIERASRGWGGKAPGVRAGPSAAPALGPGGQDLWGSQQLRVVGGFRPSHFRAGLAS